MYGYPTFHWNIRALGVNILGNFPQGLSKANESFQNTFLTSKLRCYYNLNIQALADRIQSTYCRNQCYLGHIDKLLYVSTVPFKFVPMSAVSNTVLVMSETSSTLSKENDSKKKLHITQQQEKELYQHLTYLLWKKYLKNHIIYIQLYLVTWISSYVSY